MGQCDAEDLERDDLGVSLIGRARGLETRPHRSMLPLREASCGRHRVDDGPSWRLPQLWEEPRGGQAAESSTAPVMPPGLPAYKRTWHQMALL